MATLRTLIHTLGARLDSAFRAKTRTQNGFSNPNSRAPEPTNRLNRPRRRTGSGAQHPAKLADRAPRGTLKVAVVERRKVRKAIFAARSGVLDIFNGMSSFGGLGGGAPSGYCRLLSDSPDRRNPHPRSSGDSHYEPAERRVPEWTTLRSRFVRSALSSFPEFCRCSLARPETTFARHLRGPVPDLYGVFQILLDRLHEEPQSSSELSSIQCAKAGNSHVDLNAWLRAQPAGVGGAETEKHLSGARPQADAQSAWFIRFSFGRRSSPGRSTGPPW